jgi:hypothetical protein
MPSSVYVKKKDIKSRCRTFVGKSSKDKKKCLELTMDCHMNKCKQEVDNKISAELIDEDYKKCDEESKDDFMKSIECNKKILKKSGFYEKNAKMGYCTANKCPEMTDLISNAVKNVGERLYKSMPNYKCVEEHCKKEHDELDKQNLGQITNICKKKYNNHKGQTKCAEKLVKIHMKLNKKYKNCKDTHCNDKQNTKKTNIKKSKSKSHTKKSKKH